MITYKIFLFTFILIFSFSDLPAKDEKNFIPEDFTLNKISINNYVSAMRPDENIQQVIIPFTKLPIREPNIEIEIEYISSLNYKTMGISSKEITISGKIDYNVDASGNKVIVKFKCIEIPKVTSRTINFTFKFKVGNTETSFYKNFYLKTIADPSINFTDRNKKLIKSNQMETITFYPFDIKNSFNLKEYIILDQKNKKYPEIYIKKLDQPNKLELFIRKEDELNYKIGFILQGDYESDIIAGPILNQIFELSTQKIDMIFEDSKLINHGEKGDIIFAIPNNIVTVKIKYTGSLRDLNSTDLKVNFESKDYFCKNFDEEKIKNVAENNLKFEIPLSDKVSEQSLPIYFQDRTFKQYGIINIVPLIKPIPNTENEFMVIKYANKKQPLINHSYIPYEFEENISYVSIDFKNNFNFGTQYYSVSGKMFDEDENAVDLKIKQTNAIYQDKENVTNFVYEFKNEKGEDLYLKKWYKVVLEIKPLMNYYKTDIPVMYKDESQVNWKVTIFNSEGSLKRRFFGSVTSYNVQFLLGYPKSDSTNNAKSSLLNIGMGLIFMDVDKYGNYEYTGFGPAIFISNIDNVFANPAEYGLSGMGVFYWNIDKKFPIAIAAGGGFYRSKGHNYGQISFGLSLTNLFQ